jgi:hypothetical protein
VVVGVGVAEGVGEVELLRPGQRRGLAGADEPPTGRDRGVAVLGVPPAPVDQCPPRQWRHTDVGHDRTSPESEGRDGRSPVHDLVPHAVDNEPNHAEICGKPA